MVPPGFDNSLGSSADTLPIEIFEHRRFLRVERSATLRSGQKVSKIWDHDNFFTGLRYSFCALQCPRNARDSSAAQRS